MSHKIVHWEIMGPDGEALNAFYGELFGWKGEAVPGFDAYHMIDGEHTGVAGAVGKGSEEMPSYLTLYIEVDNVEEHLAKAEAAGGGTIVPRTVIPEVVTFGMMSDPAGNILGIVERDVQPAE